MKKNKKLGTIIFAIVCIIIVSICIVIQVIVKKESKELEKESNKLETLITQTKSGKEIETQYRNFDDNKFYLKIPTSFKQLDYETIIKKYNGDVPKIVFSNEDATINIAISLTDNQMKDNQIGIYKNYMEELLKNNSEIVSTNDYQVDNHNIGSIKLITSAEGINIYNNMICFSHQEKLVIITFNCTTDLQDEWQGVGDFIIESLFFIE